MLAVLSRRPSNDCKPWLDRLLEREEKQKKAIYSRGVAKAQAMATALKTIGKFTITKRAGAEGKIFGRYGTAHGLGATTATSRLISRHAASMIHMPHF